MNDQIFCWVTSETCATVKVADVGEEIGDRPVAEHGDYTAWVWDERETNELVFREKAYRFRAARAVQKAMGWRVSLDPIRAQLEAAVGADVLTWADANVDEDDVARRNAFVVAAIADDLQACYRADLAERL